MHYCAPGKAPWRFDMLSTELGLRSVSTAHIACKICDGASPLYGVVDWHRIAENKAGVRPPLSGVPVYYRRCAACGFLFTDAFDDWDHDQFKTHVYNDAYHAFDPDYQAARPNGNASVVVNLWALHKANMRVLDYGGGNDVFCSVLRSAGFRQAVTYDPMVREHAAPPQGKFDLVTCFETLEHLPDPVAGIGDIIQYAAEPGAVLYSTLTQPDNFDQLGMSWWYVGPRNGHISMFSKEALVRAWARHGYRTVVLNACTHLAFRMLPEQWGLTSLQ
jgi:2-polyprenyl-6-hydroxyphenyl methylase/3-demethylubiquinone-9 3-methyltransferase